MARGAAADDGIRVAFDEVVEAPWSRSIASVLQWRAAVRAVRSAVSQRRYGIVHVHTPVAGFLTRYALRQETRPHVVYTAHGFHFHAHGGLLSNAAFLALERLAGRWTDALIVINQEDHRAALRHSLVPKERLHLFPGVGIDRSFYAQGAVTQAEVDRLRARVGLAPSDRIIALVAELNPGKRHEDAVRALAMLDRPNVHLVFAGDGPRLDFLRRLAERLGVDKRVHFLGFLEDVRPLVRGADVVVLPSEREGLPRSLLEAMSLGVPVIGSDIRGIRDALEGGAGILTEVRNPRALAEALGRILDDPILAAKIGEEGRVRVEQFDLTRVLELHERLYWELLGRANAGS